MQLGNEQYEQALATLERASAINPEHPVVLTLRQQVYVALKDWSALKFLLPHLVRHKIGTPTSRYQLELMLHREQFSELIDKNQLQADTHKLNNLQAFWAELPSYLQREQWFLSTYASQLMSLGEHDQAEKILALGLDRQWHGQWLDLYGLLQCADSVKPLKTAEKWLPHHQSSSHLLLALGRLCMQNQQWGRAVDFFKESLQLQQRAETFAELSRVLDRIGETEQSRNYYKQGLLASAQVLSVLPTKI